MARPTLEELEQRLKLLEADQGWMRLVLKSNGIDGPWVTPAQAGAVLGLSRDRLMDAIGKAEALRIAKKQGFLTYGKHYRNDQDESSDKPAWKINLPAFSEVWHATPPDQRKVG
ncbi:MAG: hypothetical protein HC781_01695 [Leptolyngbyaceae cyanobacterium CSU_1_4]|nr:hypothetical protein [Leptolyngbyaceae cyanobacterium CSU_1_4]